MNTPPPQPPLYKIAPPFQNMNGKKIKVTNSTGSAIGDLVCYNRTNQGEFGVRIDVVQPPVYDVPSQPAPVGHWVVMGHIRVECLCLSEQQILEITESTEEGYSFSLQLDD